MAPPLHRTGLCITGQRWREFGFRWDQTNSVFIIILSINRAVIDQSRYIKIQLKTTDLNTRLWRITTKFVGFIPMCLVVRCIALNNYIKTGLLSISWICPCAKVFTCCHWIWNSISYSTFDPRASLRVAIPRFHVPSHWGAIRASIERYRIGAIPGSHLSTTPTGHWTRRPLGPFIIPTRNCKEVLHYVSKQQIESRFIVVSLISLQLGMVLHDFGNYQFKVSTRVEQKKQWRVST